jgi:type II secretory pathway pseudopilin PulG
MKRRKGFSLIEIIMILSIVSFVVVMATPSYRRYTSAWTCRSATQLLYTDLLYLRQRAFSLCMPTGVFFDPSGKYTLWENYTAGVEFPETARPCADMTRYSLPAFLKVMLSLIPAGCNDLITPVGSPWGFREMKTVDLSRIFTMPVSINAMYSYLYFVPRRSVGSGKWQYCIATSRDIMVICGGETYTITVTSKGDISMN